MSTLARRTILGAIPCGLAVAADDLESLTVAAAAAAVRKGKVSPVELTRRCLARIEQWNPKLNAFITVTASQALDQARDLESEAHRGRFRGALHGVPVALKDLFDTAGILTTAASAQFATRVPSRDAVVVSKLKQAGAVILGKLNMDEFAYNFTSETSHFGAIRNPWKLENTPGGSSGGSAVAVAARLCFGALGSDTGGSIRLPAAFCGITGFKPSYGVVSTEGALPLAWSLDHAGPMCRTAVDASLLFDVIGEAPPDRGRVAMRRLRLGIPRTPYFDQIEPAVLSAVEEAVRHLGRLTAGARDVRMPALEPFPGIPVLPRTYGVVITAEAHAYHEKMLGSSPERYHRGTRRSIESGSGVTVPQYLEARRELERLRSDVAKVFAESELLVMPTSPGVAFPLGQPASLIYLLNTAPWNLYGLPAISIPCGFSGRLPIGLQIVGPHGRDRLVLDLAAAYQRETDWHGRFPL
jgi:aspartyl-tRNA(Asn)/glutamyl-tRNA(Gln) amidotransferase subunit A